MTAPANHELAQLSGIAIDFGGTKIAAARVMAGKVVARNQIDTVSSSTADQQLSSIIEQIALLNPSPHDAIGVAVTGRIDELGVWYALNKSTLADINAIPLKSVLETHFNRPCSVSNDVIAAASAEVLVCEDTQSRDFAYLTVSTGVGGVCVLNGQVIKSANGLAGHVGFMTSRLAIEQCGSGRFGTVESIASGAAIARAADRAGYSNMDAKSVFAYHQKGDAWATDIIDRSAQVIAEVGVNLNVAVGVSRLVIGGSIGLANGYIDKVRLALEAEPSAFRVSADRAQLGQESVLLGALAVE